MSKFNIGDTIWRARAGPEQTWIECPDCRGKKQLRVILGDDSEVAISCTCCQYGWEGSRGSISTYVYRASVESAVVCGMEQRPRDGVMEVTYMVNMSPEGSAWQNINEQDAFATQEDARRRADVLVAEHAEAQRLEIIRKTKGHKSWAWNATYHRRELKRAQEQIEYHTKKLTISVENSREEKVAPRRK